MSEGTVHICEACREVLDPDDPGVVRALEQVDTSTFGGPDRTDGLGVFFHESCFPHGDPAYRLDR